MYYVTYDHNDGTVMKDAYIKSFEKWEDAVRWLHWGEILDDDEEIDIIEGTFSDCWIKSGSEPRPIDYLPFRPNDVHVLGPGAHPGGHEWWVTPALPVYIARVRLKDAQD